MPLSILALSRRLRRRRNFLREGFFLLLILISLGLIVGFFYLPQIRIKAILVKGGDDGVSGWREAIIEEARKIMAGKIFGIFPADNFFILPKAKITDDILNTSLMFKSVSIDKIFPQKISLNIETRKPEALWCKNESCAFVDPGGFIFAPAPDFSGPIFLKFSDERPAAPEMGKNMLSPDEFKNLITFKNLLAGRGINIRKINLKEDGVFEFYSSEGWYLILKGENEPVSSLNNLELILDSAVKNQRPDLEYIDLRFGKKVFYKLK